MEELGTLLGGKTLAWIGSADPQEKKNGNVKNMDSWILFQFRRSGEKPRKSVC
jgi:hypothetical protein